MAEINAQLVKQLREMTDAGMMDCKKALVETDGDINKAVEYLREKGLSKAAKKADRIASEGVVSIKVSADFSKAVMIEINSETDFVAKNDGFKDLVEKTSNLAKDMAVFSLENLEKSSIDGMGYGEYLKTQIAKIGENIVVRRIAGITAGTNQIVNGYVHSNGRVGVLISASYKDKKNLQACGEFIRNICMHAAAMKPQVLDYKSFDLDFIQKEKIALIAEVEKENEELRRLGKPLKHIPEYISRIEITDDVLKNQENAIKEELKKQNKPEAIWDRIIPGQIDRFIADNTLIDQRMTLLGQFFVMDDKKTVAQAIEHKSKELNDQIEILEYIRFELGEGIEKKVENFAEEVMAQMK
ncbi:translation elongation factor Ts [Helicobacter cappadocius]|uniref:Elongation factor Ts n=1 Tax=Helicobacter cappadocius TaxID=3063998 RepID=A0AA90PSZ5_9HELI|nr:MULTISPECIES: translation elongation factor Ts [unclassified Helicobacter]MDO7253675.1 translation elongation factor Ts [Helicobacter sp. faydin-H75]MDP2539637.1 translation elongation factor Ts [Helicobacter sp. faydin-H76]